MSDLVADPATRQTDRRYFETMVTYLSPEDAEEAAAALAEVGYTFEQTRYVFEQDGFCSRPQFTA
jgi:hypothetical protein